MSNAFSAYPNGMLISKLDDVEVLRVMYLYIPEYSVAQYFLITPPIERDNVYQGAELHLFKPEEFPDVEWEFYADADTQLIGSAHTTYTFEEAK